LRSTVRTLRWDFPRSPLGQGARQPVHADGDPEDLDQRGGQVEALARETQISSDPARFIAGKATPAASIRRVWVRR
jgi:hypothetical protein